MKLRPWFTAAALAGTLHAASAHDTWFEARTAEGGATRLALGTGSRFPAQESGIEPRYVVQSGCRAARLATALVPLRNEDAALLLQGAPGAATCWARSAPFELTLAPDKIALYLREVKASAEQRAAWAVLQRRGQAWRERYEKNARIELGAPGSQPAPLGLDLVIDAAGPVQAGQPFAVRVLRDGQPLPGLAVELRSEDSPLGLWRQADEQGRLEFPAPGVGRWLLRAIELRLSDARPGEWDSRFASTAFRIEAAQNGSSLSSNALSANQAAATAAISSEPASSTARR